jgi:hypothetical protein
MRKEPAPDLIRGREGEFSGRAAPHQFHHGDTEVTERKIVIPAKAGIHFSTSRKLTDGSRPSPG